MLKLKRVDIQGFKSFCDRTEMRFHGSGVAAIVGPNGCGKSNLSDAISWVLGEQSAKSLRGSSMEDVIFSGTRERKPLGMAQVSLTMSDPEGHARKAAEKVKADKDALAQPSNEPDATATNGTVNGQTHKSVDITITRRLYRSGESEYQIDGKQARLRDIQDLFMGTGLGPESYAIIEQGRIGQILSNKPADRRSVIEEAAGIGKYKTRKRLAESRLESAKQNLSRVFDILEEVGRQVNSLKRQASKAKRYEELRQEMTGHLKRAVAGRFRVLERDAAKFALDLGQAQTALQNLTAEGAAREQEQTKTQESCYQVEAQLTAARARVAQLNLEIERTRGSLELQSKEISTIEQRVGAGEAETLDLEGRHGRDLAELETLRAGVSASESELASLRERLEAKAAERAEIQARVQDRERELELSRQGVLALMSEASGLRNQLAQAGEYLASMERDASRARKEEQGANADIARLEHGKSEMSSRLSARQMELESLADRRKAVEENLRSSQSGVVSARQALHELRDSLSKHTARKESLEGILSHRAYTTESVKRLFTANQESQNFRPLGVLADFVEVIDPAWERASEEFLHDELEFVVVKEWNDAERGVDVLRSSSEGRATFLVHPEASPTSLANPDLSSESSVTGRLTDVLRLTNGFAGAPQGLLNRLGRAYLVCDRDSARRLARQHPDCYFLLLDGASYHGHTVTVGKKNTGGPLALKRELREVTGLVNSGESRLSGLTAQLESMERAAALLAEELEHVRAQQQTQEKDALALDHEHRKLAEEYARAGSRLSTARLELEKLSGKDSEVRAQMESNQTLVAEKEQARFEHEKAMEGARGEFDGLRAHVQRVGEEYSVLRASLAQLEERVRSGNQAAARLAAQAEQVLNRRALLITNIESMAIQRVHLLNANVELDQRAQQLADHSAEAGSRVELLTAEESGGRAALVAIDELLRTLRSDLQKSQEQRSQIELELVRKQSELKYLDETSQKELGAPAPEVAQALEAAYEARQASGELADESSPEATAASTVEQSEQKYSEVRARIEALGPVNPQALEEYQEAQQRYEFLNTQRQDLIDSIRDTEKAIQELDVESRRRFKDAFEVINEHFKEMFKTLFGGGQGEMRLTDETNLAESGIDIMSSPPGKRLQNVALLSGGEKSLTAMALLMAIFRYSPSPFCILDEVDAPLDEANIQRLSRLIKEMSYDTQFVVITHAKRTMEMAQVLYGVTMQEPGVSKLVSVKFDPMHATEASSKTAALAAV